MTISDVIIISLLLVAVAAVVFSLRKRKQSGRGCQGCSGCSKQEGCPHSQKPPQ